MTSPRVLVFITAYNEAETIGSVVGGIFDTLDEYPVSFEVLVVDDGSVDATRECALEAGATVVPHPRNLGPGAATRTGYKYAVRNGFDITVRMDADGQHRPADIPALLDPILADQADIVIGSRYAGETGYESSAVRDFGIRFYSRLVSSLTGQRIQDVTSGFRAVRIEMGQRHAEALPNGIIAINRGLREGLSDYRVQEVPVSMDAREHGTSYLNTARLLFYPVYALYSVLDTLVRRVNK